MKGLVNLHNYTSICFNKIWIDTKIWEKRCQILWDISEIFFGLYRASAPFSLQRFGRLPATQQTFIYFHWKSWVNILSRSGGVSRTSRPSKNHKTAHISRPEVMRAKNKKTYQDRLNSYYICKFGVYRPSHLWEIACTKIGWKKIIITRWDLVASNE